MKKQVLFVLVFFTLTVAVKAQQTIRIGYVDMEYILENVPEYQEASGQLEEKVQQWKTEIEVELQKIDQMKQSLENEKALLTDELIEERQAEIRFQEQKILDYQQKRFGPDGDLMRQKLQLVQPIQDQVFMAVQEIAENRDYDLIFDKSADVVTLYADKSLDVSDQVLRSINRASRREELNSRQEKEELLREEAKTVEESEEVSERELIQQQRKQEREKLLQERRERRDSIKAARRQAYEERKAALLKKREKREDSVTEARGNIQ